MNHPRIDDEKILDRYLAGRLPEEDEALFEEHLFECAECLERVQWGEELRRGLRAAAAEDTARAAVSLSFVAWLRSRRPFQVAGLAGAVLVAVLLSSVVLWQGGTREDDTWTQPMGDILVVSLGVVRDAGGEAIEIRPDPEKEAVLLSLELQAVDAERYRVTLREAGGKVLWTGQDLEPNLYDTLLVALPSTYLKPGSYRITVEGLRESGAEPAGEMEVRILPGNP